MNLKINDTFNKELLADADRSNTPRQVEKACFSYVIPRIPSNPTLIHASEEVAALLGLTKEDIKSKDFLTFFSGSKVLKNTQPFAMCYGGHQFGNWAGQLGDGRAINLTEVEYAGKQWALQLKGSGETPYSRNADGLAVLRSSIREHLCSEAMFHLGVPTTRSLSLVLTGDKVLRDVMYNGNSAFEKGAVVCRVSPSFIRFGNFEILSSRKDFNTLKMLTDYTIRHFFPEIEKETKAGYLQFFKTVAERTREMVLHWQRVGFVHGVMNTDNMSILGLTIDYGPYGWLEGYDHAWTPNTTDKQYRRYRYVNQPNIALWNVLQLANALYPLIEDPKPMEDILNHFKNTYLDDYVDMMRGKLGLALSLPEDRELIRSLEETLHLTETDMIIFFRNLSNVKKSEIIDENTDLWAPIKDSFYEIDALEDDILRGWLDWLKKYIQRLNIETTTDSERKVKMDAVNPKYVLRNYMAQLAIDAADNGDYSLVNELHELLKKPYDEQIEHEKWFAKRPDWARNKVGCSMLSCSS
jgi:serine/tyrosine/threonine adenylyltransferase